MATQFRDREAYRPPYVAAGVAGLGVWLLYVVTLAPTTQFWDTSEYIATARILGIPHPPGNQRLQPNGPDCPPICRRAEVRIERGQ